MGDIHCPQLTSHIFSILELKKAKEYYGFVHSPAFQKQQPESAVTQNTTQREWCCIALPKRIHTKRALCKLYGSQHSPTTINIHQQPSTTINNHQQPSTTINDHQRPSTTINDHQQPSTTINNHQQPSTTINDHQRPSTTINDYQQPSTTINNHQRPSTTIIIAQSAHPQHTKILTILFTPHPDGKYILLQRED
ncbi:hypothetical protein PENPOL_c029G03856 [Penicillium polonicum]|uniref:Uncharacterized protein n=1 Tax=Penicillium polonicum TaxID=60169 RepID=A0A1V6N5W6_PENPO|nr:hypothetical protein PENPOL_c029G03856 [Penicillium polonicum]